MKRVVFAVLAAIGLLSFAASAESQSQAILKEFCLGKGLVKACTLLIQSGNLSGSALSLAYVWRAEASEGYYPYLGVLSYESHDVTYDRHFWWQTDDQASQAIQDDNTAIGLDPEDSLAYGNRACEEVILAQNAATGQAAKLYSAAFRDSDRAIKGQQDNPRLYLVRVTAEQALGKKSMAIADSRKLCSLNFGYCSLTVPATCDGRVTQASEQDVIAACTALIQSGKLSIQSLKLAYTRRGLAYDLNHQDTLAVMDENSVLGIDPTDVHAYVLRAGFEASLGQFQAEIKDWSEVIELMPYDPDGYQNRAGSEQRNGQNQEALDDCNEAIKLAESAEIKPAYGDDSDIYFTRSLAELGLGENDAAAADEAKSGFDDNGD